MKTKLNNKGFTLVELLLVIAIIGILAAVLFVSLGKQRERARITTFKENMRGLVTAATACRDARGEINGNADLSDEVNRVDVCNPNNSIGMIPIMHDCDGDDTTDVADLVIANETADDWVYTGTCHKTDGVDCVADCVVDGCEFTDCE